MRAWSENQIRLVLLRHGETLSNSEHRYLGKTDEELSKEGKRQLEQYKRAGAYPKTDYLFASPMKRCIQTADIIYPGQKPMLIEEWKEMDFGVFEGKSYLELKEDNRYQQWIDSNGTLPFPEGESREEFVFRCCQGFGKMLESIRHMKAEKEHITAGMIVHGGTIMALLSSYAGGEYFDYRSENGRGYSCMTETTGTAHRMLVMEKI